MSIFHDATGNPLFPTLGVNDPHMRVFDGRVYLYASHDADPEGYDFCMYDWEVWSSEDLLTWRKECVIRPEETYIGTSKDCWAVDAAQRHGKTFVYLSNCVHDTAVVVGDAPGGPFRDALGKPLLPKGLTPTKSYDPSVFVDDDPEQTPYIVFGTPVWAGGDSYYIAKLNDDMVSLAETPRKIELDDEADDKPDLFKRDGVYYLMWQSFYATSDNVYGPYTFRGHAGAANEHGNVFQWNNQWFHCFGVQDPSFTFRSTAMCYVHFRADGTMVEDDMIVVHGVGQYQADWHRIQAEWYMAGDGIRKRENMYNGFDVVAERDGAWLRFPNIRGVEANTGLSLRGACFPPNGCRVEVRSGTPDGELLGQVDVGPREAPEGHWWGYLPVNLQLENAAGDLDLCLVFRGEGTELFHLDWFRFYIC